MLGDKVLQLLDPVHSFFPVVAVEFGLFLLIAEPENLIGDGIVRAVGSGNYQLPFFICA